MKENTYRSHSCGALRIENLNEEVILSGWVSKVRDKGFMTWIDLRDRYGITQLIVDKDRAKKELLDKIKDLGREFVIKTKGKVIERESKNPNIPTGEVEILVEELEILSISETPPFTIEEETDGGEDLRMKYRYLDIRRKPVQQNLILRHQIAQLIRQYLFEKRFLEIETPYLIKSTPEGARDFVVPSRMNEGQFYALPQSPQLFKQLLMVGGMDRYFQLVKCFRDEDLRADRQPEFTQIDCELSFVERKDIMEIFGGLLLHLLKEIHGVEIDTIPVMPYHEAMSKYGSDKPDIRFRMEISDLSDLAQNKGFSVFDSQEVVLAIAIPEKSSYSRKEIDALINWVKRPQVGAGGMVYVKCNEDGSFKSSVDKFFNSEQLKTWAERTGAKAGDLILILTGDKEKAYKQMGMLRLEMGERLQLRNPKKFAPLWVVDFPMLEWDEEEGRYIAMHHPFTSPLSLEELKNNPKEALANAYDLVLNGNEIGGGSIRIFDQDLQKHVFEILGFSEEEIESQFGFLIEAFKFGPPPHGGIALGFDRLVSILGGSESIRDFIAFPKNNSGRDMMSDAPSAIDSKQLDELGISLK